jgi:transposase
MTKPLSPDLRQRIIKAVEADGMSRRGAAERYGVVPSTAVDLVRQWQTTGSLAARPQGGDRRSGRIEAHAAELLALVEERPDITLAEMAEHLIEKHGERFAPSVIWRFFARRAITFKKNGARQRAGARRRRGRAAGLAGGTA